MVVGGILSIINLFLGMGEMQIQMSLKIQWLLDAVRAGVCEEIVFRMFFFALCAHIVKDSELSKLQNVLCYAIMVLPHVLMHFNFRNFDIESVVILTLLFGLPFALMQRKSNLVSAIGAHTMVDLVRFCVFGA